MRLLAIDADEHHACSLARMLQKEGYAVDVASDLRMGCEVASIHDYDLVIVGPSLTNAERLEVCRHLRLVEPSLLIFAVMPLSRSQDRATNLDAGADDCLSRPYHWSEFTARLRALLRRDMLVRNPILKCGDLALNTTTKSVFVANQRVDLTAKEFAILHYLLVHTAQVVSAQELLEHVWDVSANSFTNVLRVHINSLRRKLRDSTCSIETLVGRGYRISILDTEERQP